MRARGGVKSPHDWGPTCFARSKNIKPPDEGVPSEPNEALTEEKVYLDQKALLELEGEGQDIKERKEILLCFFILACSWVSVIGVLLFLEGFGSSLRFHLSDSVLLAAIGFTTANIIGILYVVANYLFKKR